MSRYREWAEGQGLLKAPLLALGDLVMLLNQTVPGHRPPQNASSVDPYRDVLTQQVKENVEIAALWCRLQEQGYSGSCSAAHAAAQR